MKKIDSCIIIKNEEKNIKKLVNQLLKFSSEIHLTDTGSTDNTIKIIEKIIKKHPNVFLHHFEWCNDFSKARNYSFYCYESTADYFFWCDGDDVLNDKLIDTFNDFLHNDNENEDVYVLNYMYRSDFSHNRTSLVKTSIKLQWVDPIHEYLSLANNVNTINYSFFKNGSLIIHNFKSDDIQTHLLRNLEIFQNMEKNKIKFNTRNRYYYGRELYSQGLFESATYQLIQCIDNKYEGFTIDPINALICLFAIDDKLAIKYFYKLCDNSAFLRKDLLYIVGNYFFNKNDNKLAKMYYLSCINYEEPDDNLAFCYDYDCHINSLFQLSLIAYNENNKDLCIKYNKDILEIDKDNEGAKYNLSLFDVK